MALPALEALAGRGRLVSVSAAPWAGALLGHLGDVVPLGAAFDADVGAVLAPSWSAAWSLRRLGRRVGVYGEGRWLLTEMVGPTLHRADGYRAVAERLGAFVRGPPSFPVRGRPEAPSGHLAVFPLSAGGAARAWTGFSSMIQASSRSVVVYGAPAERARLERIAGGAAVLTPTLSDLAANLDRAAVAVGNDSGLAHFARACGAPTVVLFGSTTAARTGPPGAVAIDGEATCRPCYRPSCRVIGAGSAPPPCWSTIEVGRVVRAVEAIARPVSS